MVKDKNNLDVKITALLIIAVLVLGILVGEITGNVFRKKRDPGPGTIHCWPYKEPDGTTYCCITYSGGGTKCDYFELGPPLEA